MFPSGGQEGVNVTEKEHDVDDDVSLSEWMGDVDCGVLGQYDSANTDDDIVVAETQTRKETVRNIRSKGRKEAENRKKKIGERIKS